MGGSESLSANVASTYLWYTSLGIHLSTGYNQRNLRLLYQGRERRREDHTILRETDFLSNAYIQQVVLRKL